MFMIFLNVLIKTKQNTSKLVKPNRTDVHAQQWSILSHSQKNRTTAALKTKMYDTSEH